MFNNAQGEPPFFLLLILAAFLSGGVQLAVQTALGVYQFSARNNAIAVISIFLGGIVFIVAYEHFKISLGLCMAAAIFAGFFHPLGVFRAGLSKISDKYGINAYDLMHTPEPKEPLERRETAKEKVGEDNE